MPCETYRDALTDAVAAAAGAAPSPQLQSHLESCSACRAFLAEERRLFAAIDSSVRVAANAELPVSFLPRVRAGLNEPQARQHAWFPLGAAPASAALVLIVVFFARAYGRHISAPNSQANVVARLAAPAEAPLLPAPAVASRTQTAPHSTRHQRSHLTLASAVPRNEVRVLIPPGQKEAVDAWLIALRTGAVKGDILVADKTEKPSQDGELLPLSISPIEIQPLAPVGEASAPEGEKTRR